MTTQWTDKYVCGVLLRAQRRLRIVDARVAKGGADNGEVLLLQRLIGAIQYLRDEVATRREAWNGAVVEGARADEAEQKLETAINGAESMRERCAKLADEHWHHYLGELIRALPLTVTK